MRWLRAPGLPLWWHVLAHQAGASPPTPPSSSLTPPSSRSGGEYNPLVVEDDVRPPDVAAGDTDAVDAIVGVFVPGEVGIQPGLADPQVRGEDLVPLILPRGEGGHRGWAPLIPQPGDLCKCPEGLSCLRWDCVGFGGSERCELVSSSPSSFVGGELCWFGSRGAGGLSCLQVVRAELGEAGLVLRSLVLVLRGLGQVLRDMGQV